ncbi:hypothetical protein [Luteitalea sp.]
MQTVFTLVMTLLAMSILTLQNVPLFIAGLVVGCGALLIYSLRRRLLDVDAAAAGYVLVSAAVHFVR